MTQGNPKKGLNTTKRHQGSNAVFHSQVQLKRSPGTKKKYWSQKFEWSPLRTTATNNAQEQANDTLVKTMLSQKTLWSDEEFMKTLQVNPLKISATMFNIASRRGWPLLKVAASLWLDNHMSLCHKLWFLNILLMVADRRFVLMLLCMRTNLKEERFYSIRRMLQNHVSKNMWTKPCVLMFFENVSSWFILVRDIRFKA